MKTAKIATCLGSLAMLLSSTVLAIGQDEDRRDSREERIRRIEEAIERLERTLPDVGIDEELAERIGDAFEGGIVDLGDLEIDEVEIDRVMIGVMLDVEEGEESEGVKIGQVMPDSPAAKAEIQAGDVIISANGEELENAQQLIDAVQENGEKAMELTVIREGEELDLEITPTRGLASTFTIPDVGLPEGIELGGEFRLPEDFELPEGIELPEGMDLDKLREMIPRAADGEWRGFVPREGFHVIPPVNIGNADEMKEEMEKMRAQMEEMRAQMEEMAEQMKQMRELLKDR